MEREIAIFNLKLGRNTLVEVFLNDLPVEDELMRGSDGWNAPVNHLLVPGENRLDLTIHKAPIEKESVRFVIARKNPATDHPNDVLVDLDVIFPDLLDELPERFRRLPCHYSRTFECKVDLHQPTHLAAPAETFGPDGTPELRDAVMALHDALERRDADRYCQLVALRMAEQERAFEGTAMHSVAAQEATYREFLARPLRVRPMDLGELVFEPRAGGRIAFARRIDGTPPLVARATDDSSELLSARLVFTKHQGRWQLY